MNKTIYGIISNIPVFGPVLQIKTNYLALVCSPFFADVVHTEEYKVLMEWLNMHPNQVLSPKKAKELMSHVKRG